MVIIEMLFEDGNRPICVNFLDDGPHQKSYCANKFTPANINGAHVLIILLIFLLYDMPECNTSADIEPTIIFDAHRGSPCRRQRDIHDRFDYITI